MAALRAQCRRIITNASGSTPVHIARGISPAHADSPESSSARGGRGARREVLSPPASRCAHTRALSFSRRWMRISTRGKLAHRRSVARGDVAARFLEGQWIVSLGNRDVARVAELPDFPELLKALAPLAKEWVAAAKVSGKATRVRALRGQREAFGAVREAQTRWSHGDHGAAVLHDAASAAAA